MRELSREVQFRPFEGRLRFFIVDEAEKMTEEAANSILKVLEEPPDTSRLVLATAFPQRLLPTIRSRCQTFVFRALPRSRIETFLKERGQGQQAQLRAAFADGSIGTALTLDLAQMLRDRDLMLELLTAWCSSQRFEGLHKKTEQAPLRSDLRSRDRVRRYLDLLMLLGEDAYFLKVQTPDRVVSRDRISELGVVAERLSLDSVRSLLYHVSRACWDVDHYVSPLMCFDSIWLKTGEAA
jgi:DNA polymerase-3 subunit delta'